MQYLQFGTSGSFITLGQMAKFIETLSFIKYQFKVSKQVTS